MKYVVLTIVGLWFAYQTAYTFVPIWDSPSVFFYAVLIGFGYTILLTTLLDRAIPLSQCFAYLFFLAILTGIGKLFFPSVSALSLLSIYWVGNALLLLSIRLKNRLRV